MVRLPSLLTASYPCPNFVSPAGLVAASSISTAVTVNKKKKGRKGAGQNNRRLKITNTHLKDLGIDLSKDFVAAKKQK